MSALPTYLTGVWIFLFGLIIGSFLNVVIYRLPLRESIVTPRSRCTSCGAAVSWYDNIPVLSYLVLRGRCRNCRAGISPVYPLVELLVGVLYVLLFIRQLHYREMGQPISPAPAELGGFVGLTPAFFADVVFVTFIVPLVFIDIRHKLLPNRLTYPGLVVMVILRMLVPHEPSVANMRELLDLWAWPDYAVSLVVSALGALVGGGSLWLVGQIYYIVRKVEGMGGGDVKMMFMVGAYLGWRLTVLNLFIATVFGSIIGVAVAGIKGSTLKKTEIPFGAFLGPGAIAALLFGEELIAWYLRQY